MYGTMRVAEKVGLDFTTTWECVMYESMKVVQAVRDIVKENPDTIYQKEGGSCFYTKGPTSSGSCGCLIGQAILKAYPDLKPKLEVVDTFGDNVPNADTLLVKHLCFDECEGVNWLDHTQYGQDSGLEWQYCVERADKNWPLIN